MVPVVDLSRRLRTRAFEFARLTEEILGSGQVLLGRRLAAFEDAFAVFTGHAEAVGVSSGAAALQLTFAALGIGPGDEVVVPALTAVPTASAVCAVGATPVFADVDLASATLDPAAAAAAITSRTRAVVAVHLYGRPATWPDVPVAIVEDAAQAHGALDRSAPASPRSTATAYSFYPTKNLGGIGDGGAVVTDDRALAGVIRTLRVHGMTEQYVHERISQNFRMSELEAAWLSLTLPDLRDGNERRRAIARHYRAAAPDLDWQQDHTEHVFHLCVARVRDRGHFRSTLTAQGVQTAVHYPLALTQQNAYRVFRSPECPNAEAWAAQCVTLPCFPELTDAEVDHVATALAGVAR